MRETVRELRAHPRASFEEHLSHGQSEGRRYLLMVLAFGCIYFIWGSTFLAIRYAVETIPPLFVAGLRHTIAGGLLFAWCWWRGKRATKQQWIGSIVLGLLFFLIGHGTLHWAEQNVSSGMAAVLTATEPIIVAILMTITRRSRFTPLLLVGLMLGVFGVALLVESGFHAGRGELISSIVVIIGAISWSIGILYSRSESLHPDAIMAAAMSLLTGAAMLLICGVLVGETSQVHVSVVSLKSILSVGYLAIAGSLLAYSAYLWLLDRCSPTLVATHTYVNPVVALLLGWLVAGEQLSSRFLFGAGAIIMAIVFVSRAEKSQKPLDGNASLAEPTAA